MSDVQQQRYGSRVQKSDEFVDEELTKVSRRRINMIIWIHCLGLGRSKSKRYGFLMLPLFQEVLQCGPGAGLDGALSGWRERDSQEASVCTGGDARHHIWRNPWTEWNFTFKLTKIICSKHQSKFRSFFLNVFLVIPCDAFWDSPLKFHCSSIQALRAALAHPVSGDEGDPFGRWHQPQLALKGNHKMSNKMNDNRGLLCTCWHKMVLSCFLYAIELSLSHLFHVLVGRRT